MQNVMAQDILHEELRIKLSRLASIAEVRFSKLACFKGSKWEDFSWLYNGRHNVYLLARGETNPELMLLNKVFLVSYLWGRRSDHNGITAGRVMDLAAAVKYMAGQGVFSLRGIDQSSYMTTFKYLIAHYKSPAGACRALNYFIRFVFDSSLIVSNFDLIGIQDLQDKDKYGRVALGEKLPLPELVKTIIALKWAVQEQWDGSFRAQMDMLSVLTQAFQYGLGLRIGEVLRLPKNCLVTISGELYCRVWTEKGTAPIARYVPTIWRDAICEAVLRIDEICGPYREQALSIEDGSYAENLDNRFQTRIEAIDRHVQSALDRLYKKIESNASEAERQLRLLKYLPDDELVELKNLGEYLPFASKSRDSNALLKFYKKNGFKVTSKSLGKVKCAYYLRGFDVKQRLVQLIELRRNVVLYSEFFEVLHNRKPEGSRSKDVHALKDRLKSQNLASLEAFALTGEPCLHGARIVYLSSDDAVAAIRTIVSGGYNYDAYIPILDAEKLYPELFNQKTMTSIANGSETGFYSFLRVTEERKTFYRPAPDNIRLKYHAVSGFLVEQASIKSAVVDAFVSVNTKVKSELIQGIKEELLADGVEIGSATFGINQKVSDYLFVVPSNLGGVYNEHIPSTLGYFSVLYAIKPARQGQSAFLRYGVEANEEIVSTFQTHKGRHWQTNSLFRAGLAASIVNKWMGRSDSQGEHYDHQTAKERAEKVGELMLSEQSRFIGDLANKVKIWNDNNIPTQNVQAVLTDMLQTVHYGPLGHCFRDINLKPCEFHLKCLTGNSGKGCREFVVDLLDPVQIKQVESERNRAEMELARLFEALNRPGIPVESVEMHIEHQMAIFRNASYILDSSEMVLNDIQVEKSKDYQPFKTGGSVPSDCVFQCGVA
ncbi:hypothetical protein [Pseudomonas sp. S9]|uniref:hypothetical protein n=1 Tax=Pseudomonas sp. S9 TaxID=686578 RepID=UPI0002556D2E|nr:hypothetical protein [Pseudomonas sp. S9]